MAAPLKFRTAKPPFSPGDLGQLHTSKILHVRSRKVDGSGEPQKVRIFSPRITNTTLTACVNSMGQAILGNLARANNQAEYHGSGQAEPLGSLDAFSSKSHAFVTLSDLAVRYHYEYFFLSELPSFSSKLKRNHIILSSLPPYILDDLETFDLLETWHLLSRLYKTTAPFKSKINYLASSQDRGLANGRSTISMPRNTDEFLYDQLDIKYVHCLPLATRGVHRAFAMYFLTNDDDRVLQPTLLYETQMVCDRIENLRSNAWRQPGHDITVRERECLKWAAAGKTSNEIASIVDLSEHTVNHYLNSCCKKLNCVNRIQAVAQAVRLSLIP